MSRVVVVRLIVTIPLAVWLGTMIYYRVRDRSWWWAATHISQAIGVVCNWAAVALNGWRMPVLAEYVTELTRSGSSPTHQVLNPETVRVPWLTDILPLGSSFGDWLLAVVPLAILATYWLVQWAKSANRDVAVTEFS